MNVRWLFFDVGSTLVDETECYNQRIRDAISGTDITFEEFNEKRIEFAKQNLKGDIEALNFFGLAKTPWHRECESLYPDAEYVLKKLHKYGYKIGIIANQAAGTADRLEKWGLMKYISLVFSSAEEGVAKPSPEIFLKALAGAKCKPEEAVMIGDRLDNDIYPANRLGMKTIWVKQGFSIYQTLDGKYDAPDFSVGCLNELLKILL